jgi:hypothetical protein
VVEAVVVAVNFEVVVVVVEARLHSYTA